MNKPVDPREAALAEGATSEPFTRDSAITPKDGSRARRFVKASPFVWREPASIPTRKWLYPGTYVRRFVTATVAPGGVGKTGLGLVESLAMVTGRDLLRDGLKGEQLRCWYWNGEDPLEEMERQVHAVMIYYNITVSDLGDRLYLDSGREMPIRVATTERGAFKVDAECISQIADTIRVNRIDVAIFDPLISIHGAPENSNEAMDAVVKALAQIANNTNCAIGVAAHTRKQPAGSNGELSADDARGGKALVDGARVVRVLNRMTKEEGKKAGIGGNAYRRYFWVGSDKVNLTPPDTEKSWRYLESVHLPNGTGESEGDNMRVVTPWKGLNAFSDISSADLERFQAALRLEPTRTRWSNQSPEWAGHLLSELLDLDTAPEVRGKDNLDAGQMAARAKCKAILDRWAASGALGVKTVPYPKKARQYPVYFVGNGSSS